MGSQNPWNSLNFCGVQKKLYIRFKIRIYCLGAVNGMLFYVKKKFKISEHVQKFFFYQITLKFMSSHGTCLSGVIKHYFMAFKIIIKTTYNNIGCACDIILFKKFWVWVWVIILMFYRSFLMHETWDELGIR